MIGIARELAAILKTTFRIPEPKYETGGRPTEEYGLRVEAEDLCPRYDLRRVSGIQPSAKAPLFLRRRIYASGMRSINAIVDATNYVMLETGQPIHAFDATRIRDSIVVRRAYPGELMTLLDGQTRVLDEEMLVIADEQRGLVVAGVVGAVEAEVGEQTTDVLTEVATFAGRNILETSQRLGLRTDASGRFERGLDPNMVSYAMDRVTGLIVEISGGRSASDTLSHYPDPVRPWQVPLRLERTELLLGMSVEASEAAQRLKLLGCEVRHEDGKLFTTVPTFRRDLRREADLIEEVGRLVGLENVPEGLPGVPLPGGMTQEQRKIRRLRYLLADLGLVETMTYPFGPARWNEGLDIERTLKLRNPLSTEATNLRTSLLPGLLDAAARNRSFGARGVAFFEVGRVFEPREQVLELRDAALRYRLLGDTSQGGAAGDAAADLLMGVAEFQKVTALYAGTVRPSGWNVPALTAGFFEVKGLVERLLADATFESRALTFLHPGRAAAVLLSGAVVGWVGELHPETAERFGLEGWPVCAFEVDLAAIEPDPTPRFALFYNVPAVSMDLAVVVDEEVRVGDMLDTVVQLHSPILTDARVFDVYAGSQVPAGKKSVALNFTFQAEETLTDAEVKEEIDSISGRLREAFGAEVRGG
jgi:phenylalanyl-tRNA synthetase beta chain